MAAADWINVPGVLGKAGVIPGGIPGLSTSASSSSGLNSNGSTWANDHSGWTVNLGGSGQTFNAGAAGGGAGGINPWLLALGAVAVVWLLRK